MTEQKELPCKWCDKPNMKPRFLSQDGVTVDAANGEPGTYTLAHAWDDSWWPCLANDKEVKIIITRGQPADDERVKELIIAAYNRGVDDAKEAVRTTGTNKWKGAEFRPYFINAIARECFPRNLTQHLADLLPVQPAQDYRPCIRCRHEGLFSNSGTILCQKPVRTKAAKDKSTAETHAEDFDACGCTCEFAPVQPAASTPTDAHAHCWHTNAGGRFCCGCISPYRSIGEVIADAKCCCRQRGGAGRKENLKMSSEFRLAMGSDADKMLRKFIAELADKVFTSKIYSGPEYELSIFLAGYIYRSYPADIRDAHYRDVANEKMFADMKAEEVTQ